MILPSMRRTGSAAAAAALSNMPAIFLHVDGATAFMSAKYSGLARRDDGVASASMMRCAVSTASRGGTTEKMMSHLSASSASDSTSLTCAALALSIVC